MKSSGTGRRIVAVGTNSIATSVMLKAGADDAATGENAVLFNAASADYIVGAIGIVAANAMMGEISPAIASAIASAPAEKLLIPLNRCNIFVAGVGSGGLNEKIDEIIARIKKKMTTR
jgi:hypothetical protein